MATLGFVSMTEPLKELIDSKESPFSLSTLKHHDHGLNVLEFLNINLNELNPDMIMEGLSNLQKSGIICVGKSDILGINVDLQELPNSIKNIASNFETINMPADLKKFFMYIFELLRNFLLGENNNQTFAFECIERNDMNTRLFIFSLDTKSQVTTGAKIRYIFSEFNIVPSGIARLEKIIKQLPDYSNIFEEITFIPN